MNLITAPLLESAQKYAKAIEHAYLGGARNYIITCYHLCIFKYRAKKLFVVKIQKSPQRCFSRNFTLFLDKVSKLQMSIVKLVFFGNVVVLLTASYLFSYLP